jgi:formylglycine-generating enzyme required for sulfatase activity
MEQPVRGVGKTRLAARAILSLIENQKMTLLRHPVVLGMIAGSVLLALWIGLWQHSREAVSEKTKELAAPPGMRLLPGGDFEMGSPEAGHQAHHPRTEGAGAPDPAHEIYEDEVPVHRVTLSPFFLDVHEVTNEEFARFVQATGYQTDAERKGASWVFRKGATDWELVNGANWRHPLGPDDSIEGRMNHPVVHVSWNDAVAYATWAGKRLPTEAEWEYAARGGRRGQIYPWGNELKPGGQVLANFWQGHWPDKNLLEDGYYYTAPVCSFPPNDFGLCDMVGNVWEWTADWYAEDYYRHSPSTNPQGPSSGEMRVARGGSWFCSPNYCGAYRVAFRGKSPPDASFNNVGFRCARDAKNQRSRR